MNNSITQPWEIPERTFWKVSVGHPLRNQELIFGEIPEAILEKHLTQNYSIILGEFSGGMPVNLTEILLHIPSRILLKLLL